MNMDFYLKTTNPCKQCVNNNNESAISLKKISKNFETFFDPTLDKSGLSFSSSDYDDFDLKFESSIICTLSRDKFRTVSL